jgi:hypothetical protein
VNSNCENGKTLFNRPYIDPTFILKTFISGTDDLIMVYTWNVLQFTVHLTQRGRNSNGKAILLFGISKAFPVTGREGIQRCETWRLPHFLDNPLTDGGESVSLTRRSPFTPGRLLVPISVIGCVYSRAAGRITSFGKNPMIS